MKDDARILIGCPIYQREWILDHWLSAIRNQDLPLKNIGFIFEGGPSDEETHSALYSWHENNPEVWVFSIATNTTNRHKEHHNGQRKWTPDRYNHMVDFRNNLLKKARSLNPDYYFSLDSDILLKQSDTLSRLIRVLEEEPFQAVAPLLFMSPANTQHPSYMSWRDEVGGKAFRRKYPLGTLFEADVIMAAKLMSRDVYHNVDYEWHYQGEDLGWSAAATRAGFKLGAASDIYVPHIMGPKFLSRYLKIGDRRFESISAKSIQVFS
jgi:GT2 family glycosyltransferase